MKALNVRNTNQALPIALRFLAGPYCYRRESRYGPVKVYPGAGGVATEYGRPEERVVFWPLRDANPFFHLFEAIWMIAGRSDVATLERFNSRMVEFSDDGVTLHGAYGRRWYEHFGFDQLESALAALAENPDDRRQVVQIWDPRVDLGRKGKDIPCNVSMHLTRGLKGELNLAVFCRSNDAVWGTYGSDAVCFSMLLEYCARTQGWEVGRYCQLSSNWHGYLATTQPLDPLISVLESAEDPYSRGEVGTFPVAQTDRPTWRREAEMLLTEGTRAMGYQEPFFRRVALPLLRAWETYKVGARSRFVAAIEQAQECAATDWRRAAVEWLTRRAERCEAKSRKSGGSIPS